MTETTAQPAPLRCTAHPDTETYLRCGKCDTPICPRCMVQTPVGARCRNCAQLRKNPVYEVSSLQLAKGAGAGLAAAVAVGAVWAVVPGGLMFQLVAAGLGGLAIGEAVSRGGDRRRGRELKLAAVAAVVIAYLVGHSVFALLAAGPAVVPVVLLRAAVDPFGWPAIALGSYIAFTRID